MARESRKDILTSAVAMLLLGLIILAVGLGFGAVILGITSEGAIPTRMAARSGMVTLFLLGGLILGVGIGGWLTFFGIKTLLGLASGKYPEKGEDDDEDTSDLRW